MKKDRSQADAQRYTFAIGDEVQVTAPANAHWSYATKMNTRYIITEVAKGISTYGWQPRYGVKDAATGTPVQFYVLEDDLELWALPVTEEDLAEVTASIARSLEHRPVQGIVRTIFVPQARMDTSFPGEPPLWDEWQDMGPVFPNVEDAFEWQELRGSKQVTENWEYRMVRRQDTVVVRKVRT